MRVSARAPPPRSSTCHGSQWRHDVLTATERAALSPPGPDPGPAPDPSSGPYGIDTDTLEQSLIDTLTPDARLPAATVAAHSGYPESTVRRRLARMSAQHRLATQVLIDPRRLGLAVEAKLLFRAAPRPPRDRRTGTGRPPRRPRRVRNLRPLRSARRRVLPRPDRAL